MDIFSQYPVCTSNLWSWTCFFILKKESMQLLFLLYFLINFVCIFLIELCMKIVIFIIIVIIISYGSINFIIRYRFHTMFFSLCFRSNSLGHEEVQSSEAEQDGRQWPSQHQGGDMKRAAAQLIEKYYFQLTDGCGNPNCDNPNCASSGKVSWVCRRTLCCKCFY